MTTMTTTPGVTGGVETTARPIMRLCLTTSVASSGQRVPHDPQRLSLTCGAGGQSRPARARRRRGDRNVRRRPGPAVAGCRSLGRGGRPAPSRKARRVQGQSDSLDADSAARSALAGRATGTPKARDCRVEAIRAFSWGGPPHRWGRCPRCRCAPPGASR